MSEAKQVGIELALIINALEREEQKEILKTFVNNLDRNSKLQLENAMGVVI
jgi:hypothetical protein